MLCYEYSTCYCYRYTSILYAVALRCCYAQTPDYIVDFRGFYSSIILILRVGILMSIGDFAESLCQAMLVGTMLVGRLGVLLLLLIIIMIIMIITRTTTTTNNNDDEHNDNNHNYNDNNNDSTKASQRLEEVIARQKALYR